MFYLVDLLQDKNKEVRRVADQCLDVIMDTDEEWAVRIRNLKFESFNQDWLDVVSAPPDQVGRLRMTSPCMPFTNTHTHTHTHTHCHLHTSCVLHVHPSMCASLHVHA